MNKVKEFLLKNSGDIISLCILGIIFIISSLYIGHVYGDLIMDCGREAYLPKAILEGKLLFKDIFGMYNPLSYQINALVYLLFGSSLNVIYGISYINSFLILLGIYFIARMFINEFYSSVITLVIMSIYIFGSTQLISYIYPYAFAFPYAVMFYTYSVLMFIKYMKTDSNANLLASSFLLGLSLANKPEFFVCLFPMIIVMLLKRERLLSYIINGIIFLIPTIISYGIMFLQGFTTQDLIAYFEFIKNFFNTEEQQYYTTYSIMQPWNKANLLTSVIIFLSFISFCAIGCFFLSLFKKNFYFKIIGLVLIPTYLSFNISFLYNNSGVNLFSWSVLLLIVTIYFKSEKIKTTNDKMLIFLSVSGILSSSRIMFMPVLKYGYGIYFLIPLVALWIYFILSNYEVKIFKNFNYKLNLSIVFIILSLANVYYTKDSLQTYQELVTPKGKICMPMKTAHLFSQLLNWVEMKTNKTDTILMLPEGIMLNYLTERPTNLLYYHLIPNHISALDEKNIVDGLSKNKPDYIIINNTLYNMYGKTSMCEDFGLLVCKFTQDNYNLINKFSSQSSDFHLLEAKIYKLK